MVTSRDVTARVAEILPDWPVSDLRTRERWLIQAGVVPKGRAGRGGVGLAPVTLRHALLFVLGLGAPTAVDGPKYVRRMAASRGDYGLTLIEALESYGKLSEGARLDSLELPCWAGKMFHAASIRWLIYSEESASFKTEGYYHVPKGMRRMPSGEWRDITKPRPKARKRVKPITPDRVKRNTNTEPLAMRWVRMDGRVIEGVAALFAGDVTA